jgi:hypothetical protein
VLIEDCLAPAVAVMLCKDPSRQVKVTELG